MTRCQAAFLTLVGSGATTTLNGNVVTAGAPITISDSIELGAAAITLGTALGVGFPPAARQMRPISPRFAVSEKGSA